MVQKGAAQFLRPATRHTFSPAFTMLASLAILLGGKQLLPQHFAFAIPVLFAVVKQLQTNASKAVLIAAVATTAFGLLMYQQDLGVLAETNENLSMTERALSVDTEAFDRMMDRCGFDRFVYLGRRPRPATIVRHSLGASRHAGDPAAVDAAQDDRDHDEVLRLHRRRIGRVCRLGGRRYANYGHFYGHFVFIDRFSTNRV